jgi:hypothetical protein
MFSARGARYARRRVTHEEVRTLLPRYAAGTLTAGDVDAVHRHLATGCEVCLQDVFRRPVGLPREVAETTPGAAVVRPPARAAPEVATPRRTWLAWSVAVAALASTVTLAIALVWTLRDARARDAALRAELSARTAEDAAARAEAARARAEAVAAQRAAAESERRLAIARAEAADQATAADTAEAAREELERALAAAEERVGVLTRGVRRRDHEIDRLLDGVDTRPVLLELVATPGLQLLRLEPVPPFRDVRGHVFWHPERDAVLVYAFGLPDAGAQAGYRIRLTLDGAGLVAAPLVRPGPRGDVAVPIRLGGAVGRVPAVEIVREPDGEAILAGALR